MESLAESPVTPQLTGERLPRNLYRPMGMGYSSSDSLDHQPTQSRFHNESNGLNSTPKVSNISGAKTETETSSMDASMMTSSSRDADRSGDLSISNASDLEAEWVEEDEPGVYITIRALPGGTRELKRVRFRLLSFYSILSMLIITELTITKLDGFLLLRNVLGFFFHHLLESP